MYWLAIFYFGPLVYSFIKLVRWHVRVKERHDLNKEEADMMAAVFGKEFKNSFIPVLNIYNAFTLGKKLRKAEESLKFIYEDL